METFVPRDAFSTEKQAWFVQPFIQSGMIWSHFYKKFTLLQPHSYLWNQLSQLSCILFLLSFFHFCYSISFFLIYLFYIPNAVVPPSSPISSTYLPSNPLHKTLLFCLCSRKGKHQQSMYNTSLSNRVLCLDYMF